MTRNELIAALYREEGKAEIIRGEIVRFEYDGDLPGSAKCNLLFALKMWERATKHEGRSFDGSVAFLCDLPHRFSFSPDVSHYTGAPSGMKFPPTPPVFAAEIRAENDYGAAMEVEVQAKRDDYFATGFTEVVWDVDLIGTDTVRKFTKTGGAANPVAVYKRGEIADAEPAVPGFSVPVDDLFE